MSSWNIRASILPLNLMNDYLGKMCEMSENNKMYIENHSGKNKNNL